MPVQISFGDALLDRVQACTLLGNPTNREDLLRVLDQNFPGPISPARLDQFIADWVRHECEAGVAHAVLAHRPDLLWKDPGRLAELTDEVQNRLRKLKYDDDRLDPPVRYTIIELTLNVLTGWR